MTPPKRLIALFHHLNRRAGQERANLEILVRLARRGWNIELASFSLDDWPADLPIHWRRIPGGDLPTQLARSAAFRTLTRGYASPEVPSITNGVDARADVHVIHFVAKTAMELVEKGHELLPGARDRVSRAYQTHMLRSSAKREGRELSRANALIAVADGVAADLRTKVGIPHWVPVHVIRHAPDPAPAVGMPEKDDRPPLVLFVGNLERKGIDKALHSLALVKDLPWRFLALGGGDLARWRARATELGIADRVELAGPRPAAEAFARASVLLLPTQYEPFGLVVTEAVTAGCLPLASRECGALELWPRRPDWLDLSRDASHETWAAALRRALADPDARRQALREADAAMRSWTWDDAALAYDRVLAVK